MVKRLPSFNDFSPVILKGDIRTCLAAIRGHQGNDDAVIAQWADDFFDGKKSGRSGTNIPATLRSTGLTTGTRPLELSEFGKDVLAAPTALEAAQRFCAGMIRDHNGGVLLSAVASLRRRHEAISKESLKAELQLAGIESLSTNTTDHTTLKNWMVTAEIIDEDGRPNDALLKALLGISATEMDEWAALSLAQQLFLQQLRREHLVSAGPFLAKDLLRPCVEKYPHLFNGAQFARQIKEPLLAGGWIHVSGLGKGVHGGKSGHVSGSDKLLDIPVERAIPDFESAVPAELRAKIDTPLEDIKSDLKSRDKNVGGLALELLALRMVLDLGLDPRNFRLRSAQSGHAEVDLLAEGAHLMFSRWTFQCKRYEKSSTKVSLSDVAKEVGIALYVKAHVVVMVTTSGFSADASKYADVMSEATPLQFLFIDGKTVDAYLSRGKGALLEHARKNAERVMAQKRSQPVQEISVE
jgi:hypothetical protein